MLLTRTGVRLDQLDMRCRWQVDRVPFVGIEVNFELHLCVASHSEVFEDRRAGRRLNAEVHPITILHAVLFHVGGTHVDMPHRADDPLFQLDDSGRTDQDATGRVVVIAADPDRRVDAERD